MREIKTTDWFTTTTKDGVGRGSCIKLALEQPQQRLYGDQTEAGDGEEILPADSSVASYLHGDFVPIGLGLMADAVQQLVQAQVVIVQVGAVPHGRLADLCGVHQSQAPAAHLALPKRNHHERH